MRSFKRINRYNRKGLRIGYWEEYYDNGNLRCKGNYINGKRGGVFEWYWSNGDLKCGRLYKNNEEVKTIN